jgi:fatty acid desaturase
MNERSAGKWLKRKKVGRSKFISYYALAFGIGFAILLTLIEWSTFGFVDYRWIVVRLVFFATIGFLTGVFTWETKEKRYQEYVNAPAEKK